MTFEAWMIFILAVFIGSYIQSLIGFGMGLIVVAVGSLSSQISFPVLTAAVSVFTLLNIIISLKGHRSTIAGDMLLYLVLGQLPAIALGLYFLTHLSHHAVAIVELLLGFFLLTGSLAMVYQPAPLTKTSPPRAWVVAGIAAGLTGGLFSASGPVMGWFGYRQPLAFPVIRATLLSFFAIACVTRTLMVGFSGGLNQQVWSLVAVAVPVTAIGAWLGLVAKPPLQQALLKRLVFLLLVLMAMYIVFNATGKLV